MNLLRCLTFLTAVACSTTQASDSPLLENVFGGSGGDVPAAILKTSNGFLTGGGSYSEDPDVRSSSYGSRDFWILSLDSEGSPEWEKSYGGSSVDSLASILPRKSGGFLLVGSSCSPSDGLKKSISHGGSDYWVVACDQEGELLWEQSYGTESEEQLEGAVTLDFGRTLLYGSRVSIPGSADTTDAWIVCIDENGKRIWDKTFGREGEQKLFAGVLTHEGRVLLAGSSETFVGEASSQDVWMLCLDSSGRELWQKTVGGTGFDRIQSILPLGNEGYLLAGYTDSPKIETSQGSALNKGQSDYLVMRVDPRGTLQWARTYGGTASDVLLRTELLPEGIVLLGGYSFSPPSGTKTAPHFGKSDLWLVGIDMKGEQVWDRSFGGAQDEYAVALCPSNDGVVSLVGYTDSESSGNKITDHLGDGDFWFLQVPEQPEKSSDLVAVNGSNR